MSILLTFQNANSPMVTDIEIYRSEEDIPDVPVDLPMVTLPGDTSEYLDLTTHPDKLYHYRFRVVYRGTSRSAMSEQFSYRDEGNLGPGETHKMYGHIRNIEYYGLRSYTSLPTLEFLKSMVNAPADLVIKGWTGNWHKFIDGNAIYYAPEGIIIPFPANWNRNDFIAWTKAYETFDYNGAKFSLSCVTGRGNVYPDLLGVFDPKNSMMPGVQVENDGTSLNEQILRDYNSSPSEWHVIGPLKAERGLAARRNKNFANSAAQAITDYTPVATVDHYWRPFLRFIPKEV